MLQYSGYAALLPDGGGKSTFEGWFVSFDAPARAKVTVALAWLEQGNIYSLKGAGEGVMECRNNFGSSYRVYLGRDGDTLVILLTGGTKKRQQRDIEAAHAMWTDYRRRSFRLVSARANRQGAQQSS